jgi:hypothetical protein
MNGQRYDFSPDSAMIKYIYMGLVRTGGNPVKAAVQQDNGMFYFHLVNNVKQYVKRHRRNSPPPRITGTITKDRLFL